MNPSFTIKRDLTSKTTIIYINGPIANLTITIRGRLSPAQRRTVGLSFLRQIRPWLDYFRGANVRHLEDVRYNFSREEDRGVVLFMASELPSPLGKMGFEIRMQRLKIGLSQEALAEQTGLTRQHLSRIERGLITPHRSTILRLEQALGIAIKPINAQISSPPQKMTKVTFAQEKTSATPPGAHPKAHIDKYYIRR